MTKITESEVEENEMVFDEAFDQFLTEKNPQLHEEAIGAILSVIDLEDEFYDLLDYEDNIENFFLMWRKAGKEEADDSLDKEGLRNLGRLSKKYYNKRKYKKLHTLFFDITFNNLLQYIDIENHEDFDKLTDVDLFEKKLIPSEIFLQFFLLEAPVKRSDFNWHRNEEIMKQHLALLIVLFGDIFTFFNEDEKS